MRTPFKERVACYVAATKFPDERAKRRAVKKYGVPPIELEIGFLVEEFKQTPFQLGFTKKQDLALLYRSKQAVRVYTLANRISEDASNVSADDFVFIAPLEKLVFKKKKKR